VDFWSIRKINKCQILLLRQVFEQTHHSFEIVDHLINISLAEKPLATQRTLFREVDQWSTYRTKKEYYDLNEARLDQLHLDKSRLSKNTLLNNQRSFSLSSPLIFRLTWNQLSQIVFVSNFTPRTRNLVVIIQFFPTHKLTTLKLTYKCWDRIENKVKYNHSTIHTNVSTPLNLQPIFNYFNNRYRS